jgi:DNA-binding NarL/FixJ family response regulator
MDKIVKIFIADDHPILMRGLKDILAEVKEFQIVGEASDGNTALEMIRNINPDILILDIEMPGLNGLEIARIINDEKLKINIIILTMYKEEEYFNEAIDIGVKAYLLKDSVITELIDSINSVMQGDFYISPAISKYLLERNKRKNKFSDEVPSLKKLTDTELNILRLLTENKTSREISDELYISVRTVQNHRTNICNKLNLKGYNKLLQFAIQNKNLL